VSLCANLIIIASKAAYMAHNRRQVFQETESVLQRLSLVEGMIRYSCPYHQIFGDFYFLKSLCREFFVTISETDLKDIVM
jgi:hypothetical protein